MFIIIISKDIIMLLMISIYQRFEKKKGSVKDHVTLKTGVMMLNLQL